MAKKQGTTRTTITIPVGLKKRMDKVKTEANWSALACRAFEDELGRIAASKETKAMQDIVERLRLSARELDDKNYTDGRYYGEQWANNLAAIDQLENLGNLYSEYGGGWKDVFDGSNLLTNGLEPYQWFSMKVSPTNFDDASCFWEWATDCENDTPAIDKPQFVRGFADGAYDVWLKVKDQL